jgi:aminoglycoside 6'-N-acetyltransferase I
MLPHPADAMQIEKVSDRRRDAAVDLLTRFFREEGFSTPRHLIVQNVEQMIADEACWIAVAVVLGQLSGVITVTTMRYVEWGRLAEIGDLYIVPAHRGRGLARKLVAAAIDWSRQRGCTGIYVTVTPEGEARHRLSRFYERLDFKRTGRTTMMLAGFL